MRTTYHPQTDGQSERTIETLKDMLRAVEVGDKVMLEGSSWKDEVHFGKKEMLAPRYKYLADTNLHVHLEEIKVDKTLCFVEEPVEIIDREVKSLKRIRISIVKSIGTRSEDEISLRRGYCDNYALSRHRRHGSDVIESSEGIHTLMCSSKKGIIAITYVKVMKCGKTDIPEQTKRKPKTNKVEHGMEKTKSNKANVSQSQKITTLPKSKVTN
ncbi:putative reverse transcriptase domain-containing protein [Tanacetum coccineum]